MSTNLALDVQGVSVAIQRLPHGADLTLPAPATDFSAGVDLVAAVTDPVVMPYISIIITIMEVDPEYIPAALNNMDIQDNQDITTPKEMVITANASILRVLPPSTIRRLVNWT